jgi:acetolactate synthase-1/2/3 large subunit
MGPVVIALPEDMLSDTASVADVGYSAGAQAAPAATDIARFRELLAQARQPLVLVGGTGWDDASRAGLQAFAEACDLPVAVSFRRQDLFDNEHPNYVGHVGLGVSPQLAETVRSADLVIAIGTRMSEVTSMGYTLLRSPVTDQKLIHVHADAGELGRVYHPALAINAGMKNFARELANMKPVEAPWSGWTRRAREAYVSFSTGPASPVRPNGVDLTQVVSHLNESLPDDAIIANGAGNYTVWVHRFYRYRQRATEMAPTSGAMGYGLPAAIAAKLKHPERTVVCLAGDGCFMMYPQELATAVQYGAAVIVIVVNNGMLGTIRMHQEREYPGRVSSTALKNPDFVALAKAFRAHGELVERTEDFPAALVRAQAAGVAALIELRTDPLQITPTARLGA